MSVASLLDPFHVITVADEIESFINVLLYNAVERLPHDHEDRMEHVMAYFLESTALRGYRSCGGMKQRTMRGGVGITVDGKPALKFGTPEEPIKPLNKLLSTMFRRFRARYVVLDHESGGTPSEDFKETESTDGSEEDGHPPTQRQRVGIDYDKFGYDDDSETETSGPSDETRARAKLLDTHRATLAMFQVVDETAEGEWPQNEVLRNHLFKPEPEAGTAQDSVIAKGSGTIWTLSATTEDTGSTKIVPAYKPPRELPREQPPRRVGAIVQGLSLSEELMQAATGG